MSLFTSLNGSVVAVNRIRLRANGDQGIGLAASADGTMAQGGVVFDDADSTLTVTGFDPVTVDEYACTSSRLFTGYVAERTYRRGHYRTTNGREIDTTLNDSNILLQMHRINGADSHRPSETDTARLAWLLGSGYIPLVSDLGLVNGVGRVFDATQYKRQWPSDVLNDLCGPRGQIAFVYWDQTAHALGLFFDDPAATSFTSSLTISNVLSDNNGTTCFPPNEEAESLIDPANVYSNDAYTYAGGTYYGINSATAAAFFPAPLGHRDTVTENLRVGKLSTAITFSTRILARDSVEAQSITMTVRLPAAKVGLIQAGQRVGVRLSHVPGFTTLAYTRVEQVTYAQTEGTPDYYDVGLRLSTYGYPGSGGTGGGSTDPFPIANGSPPTPDDIKAAHTNIDFSAIPSDGKLILVGIADRDTAAPGPGSPGIVGFTTLWTQPYGGSGAGMWVGWKLASGETTTSVLGGAGSQVVAAVYPVGTTVNGPGAQQNAQHGTAVDCGGAITIGTSSIAWGFTFNGTFAGATVIPDGTATTVWNGVDVAGFPGWWAAYKAGGGSVDIAGTLTAGAADWYGFTVELAAAAGSNPTTPGGPVGPETITMSGASGTTAQPFAPTSLRVFVDNIDETGAIISQTPTTGAFTLGFTPRAGMVVTVYYVAA